MRLNPVTLTLAAAAFVAASAPAVALAQSAGRQQISIGIAHFEPNDKLDPMTVTRVGTTATNTVQPNTGAKIDSMTTLGFAYEYWFTDNVSGELALGLPPKVRLKGREGLAALGEIGTARMYQPAIVAKYNFGSPTDSWRPMVGLGLSYVFFSGAKVTNGYFASTVMHGDTTVKIDSAVAPVMTAGLSYRIDDRWSLSGSVSYTPFSTKVKLSSAAIDAETKAKFNNVLFIAGVKYSF